MHNCKQTRLNFVDALYDNLAAEQKAAFKQELRDCKRCRIAYRKMKATLQIADQRERTDPGESFWNQYYERLEQRMNSQGVVIQGRSPARVVWYEKHAWVYRIAAVLILVGAGVILGRLTLTPPTTLPIVKSAPSPAPTTTTVSSPVDARAQRFLNRSEVLLLALVNYDPQTEGTGNLNFKKQQELSRDLIQEATFLKSNLNTREQRKVHKLVSDLEVILLQIAHLEAQHDLPEIELVKSGVDRKGLLLKINLEQMRRASSLDLKEPGI